MVDRAALELVDDLVDARAMADRGSVRSERLAVDDERDLDDVGIGGAAVLLDGELHERVRAIVEEALEALQLPFGVGPDPVRDLEVLALDDRPHAHLLGGAHLRVAAVWWAG